MMKTAVCVLAMVAAAGASAQSVTFTGSFPKATTNWSENFAVTAFDSQGGTRELTQIMIKLTGEVMGDAAAESQDAEPSTIMLELSAELTISLMAGGVQLAEVIPLADETFMATAFDGNIDFGGTSGASFNNLMNTEMSMTTITDAMTLAAFTDTGSVALVADASGASQATGAGNIISQFSTSAGLEWEITYKYIPAPSSAALLGLGGLAAVRRRR